MLRAMKNYVSKCINERHNSVLKVMNNKTTSGGKASALSGSPWSDPRVSHTNDIINVHSSGHPARHLALWCKC